MCETRETWEESLSLSHHCLVRDLKHMDMKLYFTITMQERQIMIKYQIVWYALKNLVMIKSMWTRIITDARGSNCYLDIKAWWKSWSENTWLPSLHRKPGDYFSQDMTILKPVSKSDSSPSPSFISLMYPSYLIMKMIYRNPTPDIVWTFSPYYNLLSFSNFLTFFIFFSLKDPAM